MAVPESYRYFVEDIRNMIRLTEDDFDMLRKHRIFFINNAKTLINAISSILLEHEPSRKVFDEKRGDIESLGERLGVWLEDLLDGHDTTEFWHRQFIIGVEHLVRKIPNRQMVCLASRIREVLLPMMLEMLGNIEGLKLYFAFQRLLDSVVALTTTLVDEGQRKCLLEATGFSEKLIDNLQLVAFEKIRKELIF